MACARALISRPAVVFADEPTGNLDSRSGAEVLGFLRRVGATSSARPWSWSPTTRPPPAYADRVLFLADGRIVDEMRAPTAETVLDRMKGLEPGQDAGYARAGA